MSSPAGRGAGTRIAARAVTAARAAAGPAPVAVVGTLILLGALAAATTGAAAGAGSAAGGADPGGVAAPPAPSAAFPCARVLTALDGAGRPLFRSVAVALALPGSAAAPLHLLERGGARWERLEIAGADGPAAAVARVVALDAEANLALLEAPGLEACDSDSADAGAAAGLEPGAPIRVLRERAGYRPAAIGGRVERSIGLATGGPVILLRLLDDGGADPGLVFDGAGRFLGSTLPPPPAARPTLAAFAPWGGVASGAAPAGVEEGPRAALPPRASPAAAGTGAGLVARALLAGGPGSADGGIGLLDEALRLVGESAPVVIERGVLQFNAGRLAPAIADFERAAALDPGSHVARFNLGIALGTSGRYADAAAVLAEARALDPAHARTRFQLALALEASQRTQEARRECASLETIDPGLAGELRAALGF